MTPTMILSKPTLAVATLFSCIAGVLGQTSNTTAPGKFSSQYVTINPKSINVAGPNGHFRNSSTTEFFNPTSTNPPFFQIFDPRFLDILGPTATFNAVSSNTTVLFFAHEAPIYVPDTDELFFSGFDFSGTVVSKISMAAIESALKSGNSTEINVPATPLNLPDSVQRINGGAGLFHSSLAFVTDGVGLLPPSVVLVNPRPPYNATVLLDNFFGRQFNSIDDVKIHPTSKAFFFTDVSFGSILGIRPAPLLPNQVYRFDTVTGAVKVVATDFQRCNGIAFSQDGKVAYVTDSGLTTGINTTDQTLTATIYQYDVDSRTQTFLNRRVFAYADTGLPDGIQLDAAGNVYSGCGDGVNVWAPDGTLLGKFFTGETVANMAFAGNGRLMLLGGTKIYLAKIAAKGQNLIF